MAGGRDNPTAQAARTDAMLGSGQPDDHGEGALLVVERTRHPAALVASGNGRRRAKPRRERNALVGSAARINLTDRRAVRISRTRRQGWQTEAWDYWDEVGEIHYVTSYMANLMSKIKLYPAVDSPDGPIAVDTDTQGEEHKEAADALSKAGVTPAIANIAIETLARLRSVQGGQAALLRELSLNLEVAGECFLHGHAESTTEEAETGLVDYSEETNEPVLTEPSPDTIEDWNVRSIDELVSTGDRFELRLGPGSKLGDPIPDTDLVIRIWERHPRFSELASCSMRAVLAEAEALLLLSREVRATAKSRLSNGILLIPSELSFGSADPTRDTGDGEEDEDPFDAELQEAMITPIMEEGSASAVVPLVLRGPAELLQHVNHLAIDKNLDPVLDARIEQRILRIGRGLNMPTEVATGFMATTFANASAIKRSEYEDHVEPRATLIVDAITNGYFQWALEAAGVDTDTAGNVFVWFDPTALLVVEDMSEQAVKAHEDGIISDAARRHYQGFKEEDAPDAEELALRILFRGHRLDATVQAYLLAQAVGDKNLPIPAPPAGLLGVAQSVSSLPVPGAPPQTDMAVGGTDLEPIGVEPPTPPTPAALPPGPPTSAQPAPAQPPEPKAPAAEPKAPAETPPPVAAAATPRSDGWAKLGRTLAGLDRELRARITGKLDQAMRTALDKAGSRIRTRIQREKGGEKSILAKSVETTPRRHIAAQLGPDVVDAAGLTNEQLIQGEFESALDDINLWLGLTYDRAMRAVERVAGPTAAPKRVEVDARHTRDRARAVAWLRDNLYHLAGARLYSPNPNQPTHGEYDGTVLVPANLVRAAVAVAGGATVRGGHAALVPASAWVDIGGAGDVTDQDGNPVGGIATGPNVMSVVADSGGQVEAYQWEYGEGLRSEFIPHLDLDGVIATEPSQFEWPPSYDGFPPVDVPFPGDHDGCLCDLTPVLVAAEEVTTETPAEYEAIHGPIELPEEPPPEDTGVMAAFADDQFTVAPDTSPDYVTEIVGLLDQIPQSFLDAVGSGAGTGYGPSIVVGETAVSRLPGLEHLAGVEAPGWGGRTWDQVDGAYAAVQRIIGIGKVGAGRPESVAIHEFGHALDRVMSTVRYKSLPKGERGVAATEKSFLTASETPAFAELYQRVTAEGRLAPYFLQADGRGEREFFAEAFQAYVRSGGIDPFTAAEPGTEADKAYAEARAIWSNLLGYGSSKAALVGRIVDYFDGLKTAIDTAPAV